MSSTEFKQAPHKLLVIPGPIEVADEVLYANAHPSVSHVSPEFIAVFGDCIRMTRDVLFTTTGQPFLIAGSGTLGWDQVAANVVEPEDKVLVLHSGYFADGFADCLATYGANVDQLKAEIGAAIAPEEVVKALQGKNYKAVIFTHVDTSTGVLSDAKGIAEAARKVSPEILIVMDAVCSVASEEIQMDGWGLDIVLTASQKGLGIPPGLSILVASGKAMNVFKTRKSRITSYYASWKKWLPIMQAYEAGKPAYFATPPVNLINAYYTSLTQLTRSNSTSLQERFKLHKEASLKLKNAAKEMGLKQVPLDMKYAANGMTALYFPDGTTAVDIIGPLSQKGVVVAGGLHTGFKDKYFRIGHMGISVVDTRRGDIDKVITSLKEVIEASRAK